MKKVNEIFSDYECDGNINTAVVQSVTLRKKTKVLEMEISSDKYIEMIELESFNEFIKQRFSLNDSKIAIKYSDGINIRPIEDELKNIVLLLENKYPALKAVLNKSEYEVVGNAINFNFKVPAAGFLKIMEYDKK
ncbi:DNA polymerase III alpha subunit (gram-positive type) [Clostridium saccharobutylicum]|nr:DNA polymerase III alpha subunit (gram-positive type) [Clostridium saccharobutylicum]